MRPYLLSIAFFLASCFQIYDGENPDLRTVPVTNNPHVVPSYGGGLPMTGGDTGPY